LISEIIWNIKLNNDKSANHNLTIRVSNYNLASLFPEKLSIIFDQDHYVSNFNSTANGKELEWTINTGIDGESTTISCEVLEIANRYQAPPPNSLEALLSFHQKNAYLKFPYISVVPFYFNCVGMAADSIYVQVSLPNLPQFQYYCDYFILKLLGLFREMKVLGVYRIDKAEGVHAQDWDIIENGSSATIKFQNPMGSKLFPLIGFSFRRAAKQPAIIFGEGTIIGGVISHFIYDLLRRH
jgi:hypothetical protein